MPCLTTLGRTKTKNENLLPPWNIHDFEDLRVSWIIFELSLFPLSLSLFLLLSLSLSSTKTFVHKWKDYILYIMWKIRKIKEIIIRVYVVYASYKFISTQGLTFFSHLSLLERHAMVWILWTFASHLNFWNHRNWNHLFL